MSATSEDPAGSIARPLRPGITAASRGDDLIDNLADPEEVVRRAAEYAVEFLPPGSVPGA